MIDPRGLLAEMLDGTAHRIHRVLTDISEEDARARPQGLAPIVWQVGHIALVDARALVRSGVAVEVPPAFEPLFTAGSGGEADYPPLASVLPVLDRVNDRLRQLALEGDLARKVEGTHSYATAGEALLFLLYHRGYHIGKITTLRALLGKGRVFG
ncbi:MAG: DinB family protein [Armatimonadota bacterium]|nr:DinB family protein [Armatimonadota bacterium]MDR7426346.1 DinB family protein [Armatimonadota bacterium]MDR7469170.1 DinB family protein [Armatimonadota bacterium]MDR7474559.1 DinB family protein [Armatimonadota bacterium]MDR7538703.1 DinB family protein [Armatimonadota bacterium]